MVSKAKRKGQDEKRYSLIVAPREVVARQLGLIREKSAISIEQAATHLGLSIDQLNNLEKGDFTSFNHVSPHLHKYFDFLNATMTNLYESEKYSVDIPDTKNLGKSLGKQTLWMAIDAYTTQFPTKEALLDDIRANGYLNIDPHIPNKDLWVFIEYPRYNNFKPIAIMYSNQTHLVSFIRQNNFNYYFPLGNPFVDKFNEEIKQLFRPRPKKSDNIAPEFRRFIHSGYLPYYNRSLIEAVKRENNDPDYREDQAYFSSTSLYPNIRTHCIIHTLFDKFEPIINKNMVPFNERTGREFERSSLSTSSILETTPPELSAPAKSSDNTSKITILKVPMRPTKIESKQIPGQMAIDFDFEVKTPPTYSRM